MDASSSTFALFERLMSKRTRSNTPSPPSSPDRDPCAPQNTTQPSGSGSTSNDRHRKRRRANKLDLQRSPGLANPLPLAPASSSTAVSGVTVERCQPNHTNSGGDSEGSMLVAHATILNRGELPAPRILDSSQFEEYSTTVARLALEHILHSNPSENDSFESALKPGPDGFLHPFGLPRDNHKATAHAFDGLSRQREVFLSLKHDLDSLDAGTTPETVIQSTLLAVEGGVKSVRESLKQVRSSNVTAALIQEIKAGVTSLESCLRNWRLQHPDATAIRLDNRKCFVNPNSRRQTPTLIAYCIALVGRVFEGASERGTSFLLKLLRIFALSLTMLSPGGTTVEQSNAINDIPTTVSTLERRLNFGISTVPYAVCPTCSYIYEPRYAVGSSEPVYDRQCSNRTCHGVCNSDLMSDHQTPLKTFHYYPFFDWFGKFLSLPGIEEYGDKFCEHITSHPENPMDKCDARDGTFVRGFRAHDGGLFVADRGDEGRWFFKFHGDSFNVEGNRIRGPKNSTGVLALLCLNLPLDMANDPAYIYLVGLIQGPNEPDAKEAAHSYYLGPLIRDLDLAYTRGIAPYSSYKNRANGVPYGRVHRAAAAKAVMDLKAARPYAGFLDASSHIFCFYCNCWHTAHLGRVDFENWGKIDDNFLKEGARLWMNARTKSERDRVEDIYGTRHSAMWTLKYWKPSEQLVPEPMHTFIMRVLQNFFRKALGLDDPDNRKVTPHSFRAFFYDFTPPPRISDTTSTGPKSHNDSGRLRWLLTRHGGEEEVDDHRFSLVEWTQLSEDDQKLRLERMAWMKKDILNDKAAFRQLSSIHLTLSGPPPLSKSEKKKYHAKLMSNKWISLLYVCNDLMIFPRDSIGQKSVISLKDVQRREMVDCLMNWRISGIQEQERYQWPFFTPKTGSAPNIPWAERPNPGLSERGTTRSHDLSREDRQDLLSLLTSLMNHHSAYGIGDIHRKLQQPVLGDSMEGGLDALAESLRSETWNSLAYVCVDLDRLPCGLSKIEKEHLVQELIDWRRDQPTEALKWANIDSSAALRRLQLVVSELITPSWVGRPPPNVGLPKAGTLKADHWRTLFSIHLPLALLSLWGKGSPIQASDAECMGSVLETSLLLSCALITMTKDTLTPERRESFRNLYRQHVLGLRENFPGFFMPSHHLAFHIYEFMDSFSTVRNWWAFSFERLIGRLQRLSTNHKVGELEKTMLNGFNSGASFRQWLLHPDCPPLLAYCLTILDKTYFYVKRGYSAAERDDLLDHDDSDRDGSGGIPQEDILNLSRGLKQPELHKWLISSPPSSELLSACGSRSLEGIRCFSQVTGPRGFYTVPAATAIGNSHICFKDGDDWSAGQIQHIFDLSDGDIHIAIKRCVLLKRGKVTDPFSLFQSHGFEAKMVSSAFKNKLEILPKKAVLGHVARWELSEGKAVVLNLSRD